MDIITYLILKETLEQIEQSCDVMGFDFGCLSASGTEKDILTALLITFCVSLTLTSINSFSLRKKFFKTTFWLDLIFGVFSPILPAIYHFQLNKFCLRLDKEISKLSKDAFMKKINIAKGTTDPRVEFWLPK